MTTYKKEHEHNGFRYIEENNSVRIDHNKTKPEYLFKYYSLNRYSVEALINGYFYASHPFDLNDVFDSSQFLLYTSQKLDFEYYKSFFGGIDEFKGDEEKLLAYYQEDSKSGNDCRRLIDQFWQIATDKFGVISMTNNEKGVLMWPHYTLEKGFQIKLSRKTLEESISNNLQEGQYLGLFPINYSSRLNPIDVSQFKQWIIPFYYALNLKVETWKYEGEWRFVISGKELGIPHSKKGFSPYDDIPSKNGGRNVFYDRNIVEEITLGMDYFNGKDFETRRIVNDKIVIKLKGKFCSSNYKLHKKLLNYLIDDFGGIIYLSGGKNSFDKGGVPYLIRTKERVILERDKKDKFVLTRTNEVTGLE